MSPVMKILLLGSGGREHALFWKLSQSPRAGEIRVYPGNGGFPNSSLVSDDSLDLSRSESVKEHVRKEKYDLVVIGPEQPLVDGVADALQGICPVFGPVAQAAQLEGSKQFAKSFMEKYGIPTAASRSFTETAPALEYLKTRAAPYVIKADGLAAGKGVTVAATLEEAEKAVRECLDEGAFGESGRSLLVEDFLKGEEASVFALCDGERALPFIAAQDHKRAHDGDQGPNTDGMGAYCPAPLVTPEIMARVQSEVLDPVMRGMKEEGSPYRGLLYAGLMIDGDRPSVVEFNVRFGDPETQALLRLLDEDLVELMLLCAEGSLPDRALKFSPGSSIVVVLAAEGYPGSYTKNIEIKGLDKLKGDIICFHAGTKKERDLILSSGGRVLGITAVGSDLKAAREAAYQGIKNVGADHVFYRKDIGVRAI